MNKKVTEPIALREKKLKDGRRSLYLDTYLAGSGRNHSHSYEFLHLYLVPEVSKEAKRQNAETLRAALAIKGQRLNERVCNIAGIPIRRENVTLLDWIEELAVIKERAGSLSCSITYRLCARHLHKFYGRDIPLSQIGKPFCVDFIHYLSTAVHLDSSRLKSKRVISKGTARVYLNTLKFALNEAVRAELIPATPFRLVYKSDYRPVSGAGKKILFLSQEQLQAMSQAYCHNEEVKRAFMFACFCGLRLSDIEDLRWKDISFDGEAYSIQRVMTKVRESIVIPLGKNALRWLPSREGKGANEHVFTLPPRASIAYTLKVWKKRAGIPFDVTFHVSRHTYATSLLTQGADIYTVSKLLGHRNLSTTQVYAAIVDKKKQDAVGLLDSISLE